jgi:hypothetical protein
MSSAGDSGPGGFLSSHQAQSEGRSWLPWIIAGAVVVAGLVILLVTGHRKPSERALSPQLQPDPYASQLAIGNLQMSEATTFTGNKVTYVDGSITNEGDKMVTEVNVSVTFKNDVGEPPQQTLMPLMLIRTREPYVDIEPVSAEPLKPGDSHEFRLIFDHVSPTWNQQYPSVEPMHVQAR